MLRTNFEANIIPEVNETIREQLKKLSEKQKPQRKKKAQKTGTRVCNLCGQRHDVNSMQRIVYKNAAVYKCQICIMRTNKRKGIK